MERERIVSSFVSRLTCHVSRFTPDASRLGWSLTCVKMPCYGAVIFESGEG
jgi:hypothetical protein